MCRSGTLNVSLSLESPVTIESSDDDSEFIWPIINNEGNFRIFACGHCFYPVTRESSVEEIRNENNVVIGLALPTIYLFFGVFCLNENFLEQWRTQVCCSGCGIILTWVDNFVNPDSHSEFLRNVFSYHNDDELHVILMPSLLVSGTVNEIRSLFHLTRDDNP